MGALTEHGLEAPQRGDLRQNERDDRQVDEPDEEAGAEMQVELVLLAARLQTECVAQLDQEPEHDGDAECEDEVAGSRLPLINVADDVDLHLHVSSKE